MAKRISIICDNARYYRSKAVAEYSKTSRIKLVFLPPYSPNLNLIERFWKFFKRQVLYNTYYEACCYPYLPGAAQIRTHSGLNTASHRW